MFDRPGRLSVLPSLLCLILLVSPAAGLERPGSTVFEVRAKGEAAEPHGVSRMLHDADGNGIAEGLEERLVAHDGPIEVIVDLSEPPTDGVMEELEASVGPFRVSGRYRHVQALSARLTPEQVRGLAAVSGVEGVYENFRLRAQLDTATNSQGVPEARSTFSVDGSRDGATSYSKDDVVMAVVDTGIDAGHMDLDGGKVLHFVDCTSGTCESMAPFDDNGHGTSVASIVAGEGQANSKYRGVAHRAALVGVKVLDSDGAGTGEAFLAGVDWILANRSTFGVDIANLSLGAEGCSDGTDPASQAITDLAAAGIVPVVAAGNSGPEACTIGTPGAARDAITVGWAADPGEGGIFLAPESSRGPTADGRKKPDLIGPGEAITAAASGTRTSYRTGSGSSFATAFVAGTAALGLDATSGASVDSVRGWLVNSAQDRGPTGKDVEYGEGMLRAYEVVRLAKGGAHGGPLWPASQHLSGSVSSTSTADFPFRVGATDHPLAITLVVPDWDPSFQLPDIEMRVFGPDGTLIGDTGVSSPGSARSQVAVVNVEETGTYMVQVYSQSGSGSFFLDLSWSGSESRLFAEGVTHSRFETYLAFVNPDLASETTANVELLTGRRGRLAPAALQGVRLRAGGAASSRLNDFVPSDDLGARVVSGYRGLVAERVVKRVGALSYTDAAGVPEPARTWFVAEGATHSGFNAFLLVTNPGEVGVTVSVSYLTGSSGRVEPQELQDFLLPAGTRKTIPTDVYVPSDDVSAEVTASGPVLVEHSLLRKPKNGDLGMLGSFGTPEAATSWFLADGATHSKFRTFLLLANPGAEPARVDVTFLTGRDGAVAPPKLQGLEVAPGTRKTVSANEFVNSDDVAIAVSSDEPIVAERSMHKITDTGHIMYGSIGVTRAAERWVAAVPGGMGAGVVFVLVATPPGASEPAEVRTTRLTPNGPKDGTSLTVAPGTRETVAITSGLSSATGVLVESTNGVPIVTEMSVHGSSSGKLAAGGALSTPVSDPPASPIAP